MADEKPGDFDLTFVPSGRGAAQCDPDPNFPDGVRAVAITGAGPRCVVTFPYPAPECGHWHASCRACGFSLAVTAAGRADDPRELTVSCAQMTAEERATRTPAPSRLALDMADCPEVAIESLELHRVYILQGRRMTVTMNYAGKVPATDPQTFDVIICHRFIAPRMRGLDVKLRRGADGKLHDGEGNAVLVRHYPGPDA